MSKKAISSEVIGRYFPQTYFDFNQIQLDKKPQALFL